MNHPWGTGGRGGRGGRGDEKSEEAFQGYELDHEKALEQLRNDIFDVRLDRLEYAHEEVLQEGENDQEELDRLCWEKAEDLVLECSALEFGRDSSAEEEEEEEEEEMEEW